MKWLIKNLSYPFKRLMNGSMHRNLLPLRSTKMHLNIGGITQYINTLKPRQNGRHFADDIFKCIFLNENVWVPITFSLKFVPKGPINNISALVQIIAWRRPGDKPLSEPMMVSLTTHICVTRPQWVKHCHQNAENRARRIFVMVMHITNTCCQQCVCRMTIYVSNWPDIVP